MFETPLGAEEDTYNYIIKKPVVHRVRVLEDAATQTNLTGDRTYRVFVPKCHFGTKTRYLR